MFGECKQDAIPMHNIKETSVQKTKDSLKTPNPMEVTRSIRCLQVVCAVLAVIVIVLTATLGSLMSEQKKQLVALESRTDLLQSDMENSANNFTSSQHYDSKFLTVESTLKDMEYDILKLTTNIAHLNMTMTQIELDRRSDLLTIQIHTTEIAKLESNNRNQSDIIQEHSLIITGFEADITQLDSTTKQLDSKNTEQLKTIQEHSASIADLEVDITRLDTSVGDLQKKNTDQLTTIQEHNDSIANIEADITRLDSSVGDLQKKNTDQLTTIQEHNDSIADIEADITQLDTSVEQLQKKNTDQSTTIQAQSESIADLEVDITRLDTSVGDLQKKNTDQLTTIQEHNDSIANIEADITQLDTSVEQLQKKNTDQSTTIQAQSESIADLEDALDTKVQSLMHQQSSLSARVGNNEDSLTQLADKMEKRKVAFSAKLGSETEPLPVGSTVVFDSVIYQDGNGYNPGNGVFTCPETGVYMFSVVIDNNNPADSTGKEITVKLKVDSVWKALVVSEKFHSTQDDQNSNLVILKINQGQRVWVETYSKSGVRIWQSFSTFSGALLYN